MGKLIGYARVSTRRQDADRQVEDLIGPAFSGIAGPILGGAAAGCLGGLIGSAIDQTDQRTACLEGAALGAVSGGVGKAGVVLAKAAGRGGDDLAG